MANNNNSNKSDKIVCDMCEGINIIDYSLVEVCKKEDCNSAYCGWKGESDCEDDESDNEYYLELYNPPKLPKEPTIEDYTRIVGYESCWVDVKEYSHNLISLYLRQVSKKYGRQEANNIIKKTGLEKLGWRITLPPTEK